MFLEVDDFYKKVILLIHINKKLDIYYIALSDVIQKIKPLY